LDNGLLISMLTFVGRKAVAKLTKSPFCLRLAVYESRCHAWAESPTGVGLK